MARGLGVALLAVATAGCGAAAGTRPSSADGTAALESTARVGDLVEPASSSPRSEGLKAFKDCDAFAAYLRPLAADAAEQRGHGWHRGNTMLQGRTPDAGPTVQTLGGPTPGGSAAFNALDQALPEPGVTQPDVTHLDGKQVVTLGRRHGRSVLQVTDVSNARPRARGSLEFDAFEGNGVLLPLGGHRGLAISSTGDTTKVSLADWSDPDRLAILTTQVVTGGYLSARERDGVARIAFTSPVRLTLPDVDSARSESDAVAQGRKAVMSAPATDFLPELTILDAAGRTVARGPLMDCADVQAPARSSGLGILSVLTIDAHRGVAGFERPAAFGIAAAGDIAYGTADRLYLATHSGGSGHEWKGDRYREVQSGPRRSSLHAFDSGGRSNPRYVATGVVEGQILPTGMSVRRGALRLVTGGDPDDYKHPRRRAIVVLRERGPRLVQVGEVSGLQNTLLIPEVWWLGDLAAIANQKRASLTLVDLSDPLRPTARGEVKGGAYPATVLPVGDHRLLDLGSVRRKSWSALLAQAIDISRPEAPRTTATVDLGRAGTQVHSNPRALTYLADRHLALFPATATGKAPVGLCPDKPVPFEQRNPSYRLRCPKYMDTIMLVAVKVGPGGQVTEAARYISDRVVMRVFPLGKRLVAVTSHSVVVLDADLHALGSVPTAMRHASIRG
jgi:hypothetical protein